jgi:hypothetical protein
MLCEGLHIKVRHISRVKKRFHHAQDVLHTGEYCGRSYVPTPLKELRRILTHSADL